MLFPLQFVNLFLSIQTLILLLLLPKKFRNKLEKIIFDFISVLKIVTIINGSQKEIVKIGKIDKHNYTNITNNNIMWIKKSMNIS